MVTESLTMPSSIVSTDSTPACRLRGLWIDDDKEFTAAVTTEFKSHPSFDIEVANTPIAIDFLVRRTRPDFVVFDLRWLETSDGQWVEDVEVGISLIKQVRAACPRDGVVLFYVVSDLANEPSYRSKLERLSYIKETFDKHPFYRNVSVLCDQLLESVERHKDQLNGGRGTFLQWSDVSASLSNDRLQFIEEQARLNRVLRSLGSPCKWKHVLDSQLRSWEDFLESRLDDWYAGSTGNSLRRLQAFANRVFETSHSKSYLHGFYMYWLRYGILAFLGEHRSMPEPTALALLRFVRLLKADDSPTSVETAEFHRLLCMLKKPIRTYYGQIVEVKSTFVRVQIEMSPEQVVSGNLAITEFPECSLSPGMELVIEARQHGGGLILSPHILTPNRLSARSLRPLQVPKEFERDSNSENV